ncbi:membrane lipoprotein lipid attachment site-containing protein [Lysinibacillus sp. CTST325]
MKKFLFLILLVSLFWVSACTNGKTQSLEAFYKAAKIESIDKVVIQDGSTGASKTIIKHEQIDEFISLIKDIKFTPQDNQERRVGWRYGITLFDNKREFKFTLSEIDNTYYDSNPDIYPIIENYYKQLEIVEE